MIYFNQLEHPDMEFYHKKDKEPTLTNIARSGCGLCSLCMIVDNLLVGDPLSLEECLRMYNETGAGHGVGTDMDILGPAVAERFGLEYAVTNEPVALLAWLRRGGMAIIHSGGDREGHIGLLSHGGHYVVAVSCDGNEVCVLDPSYKANKFDEEGRQGKVRLDPPFYYLDVADALADTLNRNPHFHLFRRK